MAVYHILKDGSTPADITGHVVKVEDAPELYELIAKLSEKSIHKKEVTK